MIKNESELLKYVDSILGPLGFVKKKSCWYLKEKDCLCFFYLGKFPFGGQYENLLGAFVYDLTPIDNNFPPFFKNDLKYALEDMTDKKTVLRAFDLEDNTFEDNQREVLIENLLQNFAIPFIHAISTKQGIKEAVVKYKGLIYLIDGELKDLLGIN